MSKAIVTLISSAVLTMSMAGAAQAANQSPFLGAWTSVDTDGSNQTLSIRGGGSDNFAVALFDDAATACGGAPAQAVGSATADGDDLLMRGTITCLPGGNFVRGRLLLEFHYDEGTDTLIDFSGVVWERA